MKATVVAMFLVLAALSLTPAASPGMALDDGPVALPAGSDTTGEWAEFHGNPNNTGASIARVPTDNRTFLRFDTRGSFHSSPVVSGGLLYFGSDNGKVYAVNLATGREEWNYSTLSEVWATPLVVGGSVFVGSMDANLYALDRENGSLLWSYPAGDSIVSSPKHVDGTVVFGSQDGRVHFVNATTGARSAPSFATAGQIWGTPAIANGTVVVGSNDGNVTRLRVSDGFPLWDFTLPPASSGFVKYSSVAVRAGRAFVGSNDGAAYALDLESGALVWRFQTANYVYATPGVHEDRVFVHSTTGYLYALPFDDPNGDGDIGPTEVLWEFQTYDGWVGEGGSSPAIADGKVLVASRPGYLFCIDAATGQEVWRFRTPVATYPSFSSPAVVDGRVFVGLSDGLMYGFAPSAPGMSVAIVPEVPVIESQRAMEIVFNVTVDGQPVEGAFVTFSVTAGTLSQNGASTLADGLQRAKYLAPKVLENTTVTIAAKATKYGREDALASVAVTVIPAQDYGTASGTGFSLEQYSALLAAIGVLAAANAIVYGSVLLRRRRRPSP